MNNVAQYNGCDVQSEETKVQEQASFTQVNVAGSLSNSLKQLKQTLHFTKYTLWPKFCLNS